MRADPTVFALSSLGWKAFQDLCGTVLGVILGQTVTGFRPNRDGGRDFAFEGEWRPVGGESLRGKFVVQAKFKGAGTFYPSDLSKELPKIKSLVEAGRCNSYILMTNGAMTAESAGAIESAIRDSGVEHVLLVGGDQLDRYIRESPHLRALVPRLYGLGDLTQILDERRYQQAAALLLSMRESLDKFVVTRPYGEAVQAVIEHGLVLLLGAPAAGKSMIASAIAAASIDMWGSRPLRIDSPEAFAQAWNPLEPHQLFWIDDAFGSMQYQRYLSDEWNRQLLSLRAAINKGAKFVMTSRDYIWAQAARDLKRGVLPALESGRVVVDVHDLSIDDKRQILYNHLKYGGQSAEFRRALKPHLDGVAGLDEFLPEVARRLGDPAFTQGLTPTARGVREFFSNPVAYLEEVVDGLGSDEFAALTLIFMSEGFRSSPISLTPAEVAAFDRLGSDLAGVLRGLDALRGSLVAVASSGDPNSDGWTFKHPTIGDAMRLRIGSRRELLQIYILGSPLLSLMSEITCGDVGLQGALEVPPQYFPTVANRLLVGVHDEDCRHKVAEFLATRCSDEFLKEAPDIAANLSLAPSEPTSIRLAARLNKVGMLPEPSRRMIVAFFEEATIERLDLSLFRDARLSTLATPEEVSNLTERLHSEVVSGLDGYLEAERDRFDGVEAPEDIVWRLQESFEGLAALYPGDEEVMTAISGAGRELEALEADLLEMVEEGGAREPDWDDDRGWRDRVGGAFGSEGGVFSDVDE